VCPERWDLDLRLQAMDAMGVTIQAPRSCRKLMAFHLPPTRQLRYSRLATELLVKAARRT